MRRRGDPDPDAYEREVGLDAAAGPRGAMAREYAAAAVDVVVAVVEVEVEVEVGEQRW